MGALAQGPASAPQYLDPRLPPMQGERILSPVGRRCASFIQVPLSGMRERWICIDQKRERKKKEINNRDSAEFAEMVSLCHSMCPREANSAFLVHLGEEGIPSRSYCAKDFPSIQTHLPIPLCLENIHLLQFKPRSQSPERPDRISSYRTRVSTVERISCEAISVVLGATRLPKIRQSVFQSPVPRVAGPDIVITMSSSRSPTIHPRCWSLSLPRKDCQIPLPREHIHPSTPTWIAPNKPNPSAQHAQPHGPVTTHGTIPSMDPIFCRFSSKRARSDPRCG